MGRKQKARGAASRTSPQRLKALDKQRQAMQLRIAGASFDEIAESLGYANRGGAHKAIMAGIESTLREPAEGVRELELKRLDRLLMAAWKAATAGDLQAIGICLQIMKRRADFEGLDKPKKYQHSGPGAASDDSSVLGPAFDRFLDVLSLELDRFPGAKQALSTGMGELIKPQLPPS